MTALERKWWFLIPLLIASVALVTWLFDVAHYPLSFGSPAGVWIFCLSVATLHRGLSVATWLLLRAVVAPQRL